MSQERFPVISRELVVRVQKPDNTSANRYWRGSTPVSDTEGTREERQILAAELNALSLLARDIPSQRLPSLRFAVATVDGTRLFLASLPVASRDNAGRMTGVLVAGACEFTRVNDILAAYEVACTTFGWARDERVPGALEEVYSKSPKGRGLMHSMILLAVCVLVALLLWSRNSGAWRLP